MKYIITFFLGLIWIGCSTSISNIIEKPLSSSEISRGLKEALTIGTEDAVSFLSKEDGYYKSIYKILLPEEVRKITNRLDVIPGFEKAEEELLKKINRAAEDAAKSAGPVFISAITSMTIHEVLDVLMGEKNAATQYLENSTYSSLYGEFQPILYRSLNKFQALEYLEDLINAYNKIPLLSDVNPRIDEYLTDEALRGLFLLIEKKELGIRTDLNQRITPLLQKVFKKQDK